MHVHTLFQNKKGYMKVKLLIRVRLFATPWTIAYQAPPSMGSSRLEYWSGLRFPSPEDLPNPGIELGLLHCRQTLYRPSHQGSQAPSRSKHLLISGLQSPSAVILEPKKIVSHCFHFPPSICQEVMGLDAMILVF